MLSCVVPPVTSGVEIEFVVNASRIENIVKLLGPGEKSVMHEHREAVEVFLTNHRVKFTYPDGKTQEVTAKAGQTMWAPAVKHLPENIGDGRLELILVEIKVKEATTKKN